LIKTSIKKFIGTIAQIKFCSMELEVQSIFMTIRLKKNLSIDIKKKMIGNFSVIYNAQTSTFGKIIKTLRKNFMKTIILRMILLRKNNNLHGAFINIQG